MIGLPASIVLFSVYYFLIVNNFDPELVKTFIFASFASYSLFVIFAVRSLRKSVFKINPFSNPFLIIGVLLGLGSIAAVIYVPFLQEIMGIVALPLPWLLGVVIVGIFNLMAIELGKYLSRKWKLNG